MRERIVLIGAGSAMFTCGMVSDLLAAGMEAELALVDIDPGALEVAARLARKMVGQKGARLTIAAGTDRRQMLPGATAVIVTIGVGGRRAWEQDVLIPRKYGIYQPVGDSVMPGGASRALRMIPAMVEIARDVRELAPAALFFNYSNPMTAICRAVDRATGAGMIGLCHGVTHTARYLARMLAVAPEQLDYTAVGLNHLTWFTALSSDGQDLSGRLQQVARERLAAPRAAGSLGEEFLASGSFEPSPGRPEELNLLSWELALRFGAFPSAMDRHVTEFFPWLTAREGGYYGKTLGTECFSFERTIEAGDRIFAEMGRLAAADGPLPESWFARQEGEHEQVMEIIRSIREGNGRVFLANLPNRGQVPNLPAGAVLESPARATAAGLEPVPQPPLPAAQAGILAMRLAWAETVVEAALEGSREKFIQALLLDGVGGSTETIAAMAEELLAAQARYLPWYAPRIA